MSFMNFQVELGDLDLNSARGKSQAGFSQIDGRCGDGIINDPLQMSQSFAVETSLVITNLWYMDDNCYSNMTKKFS